MSDTPSKAEAIAAVETLLRFIEPSTEYPREGLTRTPERVVDSYSEIFSVTPTMPSRFLTPPSTQRVMTGLSCLGT